MRRFPSSWSTVLAQLGFRRKMKQRKGEQRHRMSRIETLEVRALLSGDPIVVSELSDSSTPAQFGPERMVYVAKPEFFLVNESLSDRQLEVLKEDPNAQFESLYVVRTEQTRSGPKAVVSLNPNYGAEPPSALQELHLELRLQGQVLENYVVQIDIAEESFLQSFLDARIKRAEAEVAAVKPKTKADWLGDKETDELLWDKDRLLDAESTPPSKSIAPVDNFLPAPARDHSELSRFLVDDTERHQFYRDAPKPTVELLSSLAKRQSKQSDVLVDDAERHRFYSDATSLIREVKTDRLAADTDAKQKSVIIREKSLRNTALLLAKDIRADLESSNSPVAAAAKKLRDELVAMGDIYSTLFTGLKVDHEVERGITNRGDTRALSFVETGRYSFNHQLEIDLGKHQAMIQVTQNNLSQYVGVTSVTETPAVEDAFFYNGNPDNNYGSSDSHIIYGSGSDNDFESLIRFNLDQVADLNKPTPISDARFQLTEIPMNFGDTDVYVWNGLLPSESGGVTDWDESNLTWNRAYTTLDLEGNIGQFTKLTTWTAGATFDVDATDQVRRGLLYGDANGDGQFSASGIEGDIEAFHLAVTNWDAYVAEYGPRASSINDLITRNDAGLGDGVIDASDISDFFRRHGVSQGDYNLDGTVQDNQDSGIDGLDWAVYQANFGLENARFSQGDGTFDGKVDIDDFAIWSGRKGEDNLTPVAPEIMFWLRPGESGSFASFASQENTTVAGPTLAITEQLDLALNAFTVSDTSLRVDYSVLAETFTDVKVQIYKAGAPDTLLYESSVQSGDLGSHEVLIATSVLSSITEGDSIYAKVVGTPSAGAQANLQNDQLDFEFTTDRTQVVNSLDDGGMDNLITAKHTLRELLEADKALDWFDTITFDPSLFDEGNAEIRLGDLDGDGIHEQLFIASDVTLTGPGAHLLTLSGNDLTRVIRADQGTEVTIENLRIAKGSTTSHGGGIYSKADLTLNHVVVVDNSSGEDGGGVYSTTGSLTIFASTLARNTANMGGGLHRRPSGTKTTRIEASSFFDNTASAIYYVHHGRGGGMQLDPGGTGQVEILNSTFSGNKAVKGGGIDLLDYSGLLPILIVNSTITDNETLQLGAAAWNSVRSGGIEIFNLNGKVTMHNSIVANNTSTASWSTNLYGNLLPGSSNNLIQTNQQGWATGGLTNGVDGNIILQSNESAQLAPLNSYGGATRTHMPYEDSLVVDQGSDAVAVDASGNPLLFDQRGFDRYYDVPGVHNDGTNTIDIGAYEDPPIKVTSLDDYGVGGKMTLRQAIASAAENNVDNDIITFDPQLFASGTQQTLTLQADPEKETQVVEEIKIDTNVTIVGPGAELLAISGDKKTRVLSVLANNVVEISRLTVTEGKAGWSEIGAGIKNEGDLTLREVVVERNIADNHGGGIAATGGLLLIENSILQDNEARRAGGLYATESTIQIVDSTLRRNTVSGWGGAVHVLNATADFRNSTLSDNTAGAGGGLLVVNYLGDVVTVSNSTISNNTATNWGGVYFFDKGHQIINSTIYGNESTSGLGGGVWINVSGGVTIHNSIIAGNTPSSSGQLGGTANPASSNNIIGLGSNGDLIDNRPGSNFNPSLPVNYVGVADAGLLPLGDYGGPTQTHALAPNSPAIDTGTTSGAYSQLDQRGFDRYDNPTISGSVDIGAYEFALMVSSVGDTDDGDYSFGNFTLREAVNLANANSSPDTIRFAEELSGATIYLDDQLVVEEELTILGPGAKQLTIDAQGKSRIFLIRNTAAAVTISGISMAGGKTSYGGAIHNSSPLLVLDSVAIVNNIATSDGGGVYNSSSAGLDVNNSELSWNSASKGGAISTPSAGSVAIAVTNSTIAYNSASDTGGGLYIRQTADVTIQSSTISGNIASADGGEGGIFLFEVGTASIVQSTIAENTGGAGGTGGILASSSPVAMHNTIVADNHLSDGSVSDVGGALDLSSSYNLIGLYDLTTSLTGLDNILGTIAVPVTTGLAPLGDYGGTLQTHALYMNSDAIDAGNDASAPSTEPFTDQRGFQRIVDFRGLGGSTVDIGAFELAEELTESVAGTNSVSGDFNNDGRLDEVFLEDDGEGNRSLRVHLGGGVAGSGVWADIESTFDRFYVGDFNGDGRDDLLLGEGIALSKRWRFALSESNRFVVHVDQLPTGRNWPLLLVGDFDGDGSDEAAGFNEGSNASWEVLNYSEQFGTTRTTWSDPAVLQAEVSGIIDGTGVVLVIHVGDANGDGRDDLVAGIAGAWKVALAQDGVGSFVEGAWGDWFDNWSSGSGVTQIVDVEGPNQKIIDVFSKVYNEVELELYTGFMKGVDATEQTKAGNPWDQAALLEQRLTDAGFDAEIVIGKIKAPVDSIYQWLGVPDELIDPNHQDHPGAGIQDILDIVSDPSIAFDSGISPGTEDDTLTFNHAWVEVVAPGTGAPEDLYLDPSWNQWEMQVGIAPGSLDSLLVEFNELEYLTQLDGETAFEFYERQLISYLQDQHPGKSLADIAFRGSQLRTSFSTLPAGLGEGVVEISSEMFDSLPTLTSLQADDWTHSLEIHLLDATQSDLLPAIDLSIPEYSLATITLTYDGTNHPVLTVTTPQAADPNDPELPLVFTGATPVTAGDNLEVKLIAFAPEETVQPTDVSESTSTTSVEGLQPVAIVADASQFSIAHTQWLHEEAIDAVANSEPAATAELLAYMGARYLQMQANTAVNLAKLTNTAYTKTRTSLSVNRADDGSGLQLSHLPFGFAPTGVVTDNEGFGVAPRLWSSGKVLEDAQTIRSMSSSFDEQRVIEEVLGVEALSTVGGLKRAAQRNLGVDNVGDPGTDDSILVITFDEAVPGPNNDKYSIREAYRDGSGQLQQVSVASDVLITNLREEIRSALKILPGSQDIPPELGISNKVVEFFNSTLREGTYVYLPRYYSNHGSWRGYVLAGVSSFDDASKFTWSITTNSGASSNGGATTGIAVPLDSLPAQSSTPFQPVVGDPVNIANGNMFRDEVDILFPSIGQPLHFARRYNSQLERDIGLGVGWTHAFSEQLIVDEDDDSADPNYPDLIWLTADGQEQRIDYEGSSYVLPNSLLGTFSVIGGGSSITGYTYFDRDGTEYHFDRASLAGTTGGETRARLSQKLDLNGNGIAVTYSNTTTTQIATVTDVDTPDRRLLFDYDGSTHVHDIEKTIDGEQSTIGPWKFTYDGSNTHLTSVESPIDEYILTPTKVEYKYYMTGLFTGLMERITEPNGNYHDYEYYLNKRVFRVTESVGAGDNLIIGDTDDETVSHSFTYNLVQNRTEFTNERGEVETYVYQPNGLLTRQIHSDRTRMEFEWGTIGETDEFLMRSTAGEVGAASTFSYYGDFAGTISTDPNYRDASDFDYRELYQTTSKHFVDGSGVPLDPSSILTTDFEYTQPSDRTHLRLVNSITVDANGDPLVTSFNYDHESDLNQEGIGQLTLVTDPLGNKTTFEYFDSSDGYKEGLLERRIDPNGYDEQGRLVRFNTLSGTAGLNVDVDGDTLTVRLASVGSTIGDLVVDAVRIRRIDDVEQLVGGHVDITVTTDDTDTTGGFSIQKVGGGAPDAGDVIALDSNDALTGVIGAGAQLISRNRSSEIKAIWTFTGLQPGKYQVSVPVVKAANGNYIESTNATYQIFNGAIDANPENVAVLNVTTASSTFFSHQTTFDYDTAGNLVSSQRENHTATTSEYDSSGGVTLLTDRTGVASQFQYDVLGRQQFAGLADPDGLGPLIALDGTFDYNASSQLTNTVDQLGRSTSFGYDLRGNVTEIANPDDTKITYAYDAAGNRVSVADELGRTVRFFYDSRDRLIQTLYPDGVVEKVHYDGTGRIAEVTDGRGNSTSLTYDARGRLTSGIQTLEDDTVLETTNKYDIRGNLIETIDPEGHVTQFLPDELNRVFLTRVLDEADAPNRETSNPTVVSQLPRFLSTFEFDDNGNIIQTVVYDASALHDADAATNDPILKSDDPRQLIDSYPALIQLIITKYDAYNRPIQSINADGTTSQVHFDGGGRVRFAMDELDRVRELRYDKYGRLQDSIVPDADTGVPDVTDPTKTTFEYDAAGNTVAITDANINRTEFTYDLFDQLVTTTDAMGNVSELLYDLAGQSVARIDALGRSVYAQFDERGRVVRDRLVDLDAAGPLAASETQYEYDANGNLQNIVDPLGFLISYEYDAINRLSTESITISDVADDSGHDGDASFAVTGDTVERVTSATSGYAGDVTNITGGTQAATASWTFDDLAAGDYRIAITWQHDPSLDSAASVDVSADGISVGSAETLKQHNAANAPSDFARVHDGRWLGWKELSADVTVIEGGSIEVELTASSPTATIQADAVLIERIVDYQYEYDKNSNLISETDSVLSQDGAAGRVTIYDYDELNRLIKTTAPDPDGIAGLLEAPVVQFVYDGYGNIVETQELRGGKPDRLTTSDYDKRNRLITETFIDPLSSLDDYVTKYFYDEVGNLTAVYDAFDTNDELVTIYGYNSLNRLTTELIDTYRLGELDGTNSPNDRTEAGNVNERLSTSGYDLSGNLIRSNEFAADAASESVSTTYEYDALNRLMRTVRDEGSGIPFSNATSHFFYDAVGNLTLEIDPTGRAFRSTYNDLNQLTESFLPDLVNGGRVDASNKFSYDTAGNLVSQENGEGETTRFLYDSLGRQIRTVNGNGDESRQRYDNQRLIDVFDPGQNRTQLVYDDLDRIVAEQTYYDATNAWTRTFEFDDAGNLERAIDRDDRVRDFKYDGFNRVLEEVWFANEVDANAIQDREGRLRWTYDELDRVTHSDFTAINPVGGNFNLRYEDTFEYDNLGRVTVQRNHKPDGSFNLNPEVDQTFAYDLLPSGGPATAFLSSTSSLAIAEGSTFSGAFTTDRLGRLAEIVDNAVAGANVDAKTIGFTYDLAGRLTGIERDVTLTGFHFDTSFGYDESGRLATMEHVRNQPAELFVGYAYSYDDASRISSIDTSYDTLVGALSAMPATQSRNFDFDLTGQLTSRAGGTSDHDFEYDDNGNATTFSGQTHTFGTNNRLADNGEFSYTYNNEGTLKRRDSNSDTSYTLYEWDHRNRLANISEFADDVAQTPEKEVRYRYSNDDLRVRKEVYDSSSTKVLDENYVYDGGQLVLTLDENGNPLHRYLNGAGVDTLLVDEAFTNGSVTQALWAATDHQGSVRQLVDAADHAIVEHREFDPFGELAELYDESGALEESDGEPDTAALDSAFAFAGREWDDDAGLYYNRARYYDASVGRFLGEDPALSDPNLYRYAGNDPVNFRDPSGLTQAGNPVDGAIRRLPYPPFDASLDRARLGTPGYDRQTKEYEDWLDGLREREVFDNPNGLTARILEYERQNSQRLDQEHAEIRGYIDELDARKEELKLDIQNLKFELAATIESRRWERILFLHELRVAQATAADQSGTTRITVGVIGLIGVVLAPQITLPSLLVGMISADQLLTGIQERQSLRLQDSAFVGLLGPVIGHERAQTAEFFAAIGIPDPSDVRFIAGSSAARVTLPGSGRVFAAAGDEATDFLRGLTFQQKKDAKHGIIDFLRAGDDFSAELAGRILSKDEAIRVHLQFANGLGRRRGQFKEGSNIIQINSRLIAEGDLFQAASSAVHEGRHFMDDLSGRLGGFPRRRAEFRAEAQEFGFQLRFKQGRLVDKFEQGGFIQVGLDIEKRNGFFLGY